MLFIYPILRITRTRVQFVAVADTVHRQNMRLLFRALELPATSLRNGIISPNVRGPLFSIIRSISTDTEKAPPSFKRPMNAYNVFVAERIPLLMTKYNDTSLVAMAKKAAEEWRELSDSVKQTYIDSAKAHKDNYLSSLTAHAEEKGITIQELRKQISGVRVDARSMRMKRKLKAFMRENQHPRRPEPNGFALFVKECFEKQQPVTSREVAQETIKAAAEAWKEVPEDAKKTYNEKAAVQNADYRRKVEVWKVEMVKLGAEDVIKKLHQRAPLDALDEARIERMKQQEQAKRQRAWDKRRKDKLKKRVMANAKKQVEKLRKLIDRLDSTRGKKLVKETGEWAKIRAASAKKATPELSTPEE